ncbi:hypothetical protein ANN_11611 [Periplaneta americana]|uniref:Uncharacterized protein n=1 Tax=Periplaneta americana TaxID=6978 RepID=A0ABQ8T719_PERAM|nr:hypothetical protein ANN_11611 [Periplaneta americana]
MAGLCEGGSEPPGSLKATGTETRRTTGKKSKPRHVTAPLPLHLPGTLGVNYPSQFPVGDAVPPGYS